MLRLPSIETVPAGPRRVLVGTGLVIALVGASTLVVGALETWSPLPDASSAYIPAVAAVAALLGTMPAIAASVAAFLVYDFLFVEPTFTFNVAAPAEWLSLFLFLVVAVIVGRLTALLATREREAAQRAREARVLFAVSLDLAAAPTVVDAIRLVVERLRSETRMSRVWCGLGPTVVDERIVADTGRDARLPPLNARFVLERDAAGGPAGWVRVREQVLGQRPGTHARQGGTGPGVTQAQGAMLDENVFRVPLVSSGTACGSLWASRARELDRPSEESTRFLVAAADQIAGAVERDRLATAATEAEIARQSDALKSALLDSVSHDLRTPLAAIRVAAGHLADPAVTASPEAARASARTIEAEATRLDRLVTNILDLSRIESGALRPVVEPYDLADLVGQVADRLAPALTGVAVRIEIPGGLPPVLVDPILVDQVLTNLLENAAAHAGPDRIVRISASTDDASRVELVVEDSGPGVPPRELHRIFEKFYRATGARQGGRGMGIGLAVVHGLVAAMGGETEARRSALGGLAVAVRLPAAPEPAEP